MNTPACYLLTFLLIHIFACYAIKVDKVYLYNETDWVGSSPVRVFCDVTTEGDEEVAEVQWRLHDQLVYHWFNDENNTIIVLGLLEERVELPRNRSDWNLKITRISLELQGNFSCTAVSDDNSTHTGGLPFIIDYAPEVNKREWTSDCQALATLHYPRVYPRPIVAVCYMEHKQTSFSLKLQAPAIETQNEDGTWEFSFQTASNFTDYPEGSNMRCYRYLYGEEVEMINWVPEEEKDCPLLDPIPSHPNFELTHQLIMTPCRTGVMAGSFLEYTCTKDMASTLNNTCQVSGMWSVDLDQGENWPRCAAGGIVAWRWNLLACVFLLSSLL